MKKVIIAPYLTGFGGTETVLNTILKNDEQDQFLLLLPQGVENRKWLEGLSNYSLLKKKFNSIIVRQIVGTFFIVKFLLFTKNRQIICMSDKIIKIVSSVNKLKRKKLQIISWIHFSLEESHSMNQAFLCEADFHLAISSGIKKQLIDLGISNDKVEVIGNPIVKPNKIIPASKNENILKISYMGRLLFDGQKNIEELLSALSKFNLPYHLDFYGDGNEKEKGKIKEFINKYGMENNISFHGWVSQPFNKIEDLDYVLLTSKYEGFPMIILESLSYGIPFISSDCPTGPADVIREGENGYLYKSGDIVGLVSTLNIAHAKKNEFSRLNVSNSVKKYYVNSYISNLVSLLEIWDNKYKSE